MCVWMRWFLVSAVLVLAGCNAVIGDHERGLAGDGGLSEIAGPLFTPTVTLFEVFEPAVAVTSACRDVVKATVATPL